MGSYVTFVNTVSVGLPTIGQPVSNKEEQGRVGESESKLELLGASVSVTASCHNDLQSNDY